MNAVPENVVEETKKTDTPETKVNEELKATAAENTEEKLETENISCCGSCS
jgi:hypothetical protein